MLPFRAFLLLLLGGAAAFPGAAATEPSLAPQIATVFPHGGRLGSSFEVAIGGAIWTEPLASNSLRPE